MCCSREIVLQASTALSNPPSSAEASPVAAVPVVPLLQLEQDIQAMRTVVQAQQTQLQTLQALKQSQPLVGLTTDQPWGLALEGLSLGLLALVLGGGAWLALHTWPRSRRARAAVPAPGRDAAPGFSDSMLYLADHEDAQESLPPVTTHLHDPQHDAKASTLAHEDGDPALEYHRMALTAQGLSVTAGAGQIDSDRFSLDEPSPLLPLGEKEAHAIFSPSMAGAEFDQRAAAEEVERVRRNLAQRRADRAQTAVVREPDPLPALHRDEPVVATLADAGSKPLTQVDIPLGLDVSPGELIESPEHTALSDRASSQGAPGEAACAPEMLAAPLHDAPESGETPMLPSAYVQLALAQEFRDLGLWDEAKARVHEVLEQPDAGQHAQAQALLEALQQMAPAPRQDETPRDD